MSSWRILVMSVVIVAGPFAGPMEAAGDEPRWTLRGFAVWVDPAGDDLAARLPTGEPYRFRVDGGSGAGLEGEYRFKPRLGVELAALAADLDAEVTVTTAAGISRTTKSSAFELYSVGLNYHRPVRRLDLHAGVFAAIVYFDDVVFPTGAGGSGKLVFDDDTGFGVKLGLDLPVGASERWLVSLSARYLGAILEGEAAGQDADLDPLIVSLGVGYRF